MIHRVNIAKIANYPKADSVQSPLKIPTQFFTRCGRMILNSIWKNEKPRIPKTTLYKRTARGITIPGFKFHYRVKVKKIAWYWQKTRQVDQLNQIKDSDVNPHTYGHMIFEKKEAKL